MKKILKRLLIGYICLCIIGTVSFFAVGNGIFRFSLTRKSTSDYKSYDSKRWIVKTASDMYITSEDGLTLHGHFAENPSAESRYAIVCHGYSGNAATMSSYSKKLYDMGFSVLNPNARAHGKSQGNVTGMGYLERRDIILWINEIIKLDPEAEILLFGVSMGGATVLFTSGENDLPANVRAVISDCAFTRVYEQFGSVIRGSVPFLPNFPIVDSASVACEIRGGYSFRDASCINAVKRSRTPTLFIHGSADTYVPFYMLNILYKNAACEKEKLVIDGAGHADAASVNSELYWETVKSFTDKYFKEKTI